MGLSILEENPRLCQTSYHSIFTSNLQISNLILTFYICPPCCRYKNISEQMWSDHFPINRDLNYHIYPFYFFWKVFRGCISMTSLPKDLHLKGCCSNLIHIWHNVFSCRTLWSIWKSVFSRLYSISLWSFLFLLWVYSKWILCVLWKMKKNQKMFIFFIQFHFDFSPALTILPSPWGVLPTGACRTVSLGFLGFLGARTSINLKGAQCLVDGESRLIFISDSLLFSCESKSVWNHPTCPDGLFCTSSSSSSQWKLRLHPTNPS